MIGNVPMLVYHTLHCIQENKPIISYHRPTRHNQVISLARSHGHHKWAAHVLIIYGMLNQKSVCDVDEEDILKVYLRCILYDSRPL